MKHATAIVIAGVMLAASVLSSPAHADTKVITSRQLPVLVKVDAQGHVGKITPAYTVTPALLTIIRNTLEKMVKGPAMKNGKPVESQMLTTFAIVKRKSADGHSKLYLTYVSTKHVKPGARFVSRRPPDSLYAYDAARANMIRHNNMRLNIRNPNR